jgi:Protein of unknown function (DUF3822)
VPAIGSDDCPKDWEKYSNIATGNLLQTVLEILPAEIEAHKCILICEISNEGLTYAIKDDDTNTFIGLSASHFKNVDNDSSPSDLKDALNRHPYLSENFRKVHMVYSFEDSVLIPFNLYDFNENSNVLNLVHGDMPTDAMVLTDVIENKEMYNSYRIPAGVHALMTSWFPGAVNSHQYTVLLKQPQVSGDKLSVIFYSKKIVMMVTKNAVMQIINSFSYKTADDVLYVLLNARRQYDAEDIPLEISGLLEPRSALAGEIHKYFSDMNFTEPADHYNCSEEIRNHPSHYFSHIFGVASCE